MVASIDEYDENDTASILAELLEISNKSNGVSRFHNLKPPRSTSINLRVKFNNGSNTNTHSEQTHTKEDSKDTVGDEEDELLQIETAESFLKFNPEKGVLNQYWYSSGTIKALCDTIKEVLQLCDGKKVAFLSTPSLYFAFPIETRKNFTLFDIDTVWKDDDGFEYYDFKKPGKFNETLRGSFDMVVIDPPFITREVWESYAITTKLLLKHSTFSDNITERSFVLGTTVVENKSLMGELFGTKPTVFRPSVPHLVYQYNIYLNCDECTTLKNKNPEIIEYSL